jgi:hypothetical protein
MEARNRSDKTKSKAIPRGTPTPFKPIKPLAPFMALFRSHALAAGT